MDTHSRLPGRSRAPLVVVLLGVLIAIAVSVLITRREPPAPDEAFTLNTRLGELRAAIKTYRTRHGHGPATLRELVTEKLLREVPVDPITRSATTWRLVTEESVAVQEDFRAGGGEPRRVWIIDVHSGANGNAPDGRAWSAY